MTRKILNVGCGEDTYGTHFIDLYPTRKEVIKCDVNKDKFPFPSNYFDEIIAIALFEHLTNPLNFLKESYRTLKIEGKLILITDNATFYGLLGKTHYGAYEKGRRKEGFENDKHSALFTPVHLKNWLENVGFRRIKVEYYVYPKHIKFYHKPFIKILSFFVKRLSPHIKAEAMK